MFTAENARKLTNSWSRRDERQLLFYERKIKKKISRGKTEIVSSISPRPNVVSKLREAGYDVIIGYPFGIVIKW